MDIFYSQKLAVNSFEGATLGQFYGEEYGLVCFSKNLIKCYLLKHDGSILLLYSNYLLENIIQLERYSIDENRDGLVVLFESSKISLISFKNYIPVVESLKYFEKDEFDLRQDDLRFIRVYDYIGVGKVSKYYLSVFSLSETLLRTRVYNFSEISEKIKNVIDFVFLENYKTPTVCLIYNPKQCSYVQKKDVQAIIFSYDFNISRLNILEEFQVPQDTHRVLFSRNTLAFISHNDIVFRTSNSCYSIGLNKMSQKEEKHSYDIILNGEKVFFKDETLIIVNGDGSLYKFLLIFDSKRIIDVQLKSLGKIVTPRFVSVYKDLVFIGSNECSVLCKMTYEHLRNDIEKESLDNHEDVEDVEYRKLYADDVQNDLREEMKLNIFCIFHGMGNINDLFLKDKESYLVASEGVYNNIYKVSKVFKPGKEIKSIQNGAYDATCSMENCLLMTGDNCTVEVNDLLEVKNQSIYKKDERTLLLCRFEDDVYQITEENIYIYSGTEMKKLQFENKIKKALSFESNGIFNLICLDLENFLIIYDENLSKLEEVTNVVSFSQSNESCYLIVNNSLVIYNLNEKKFIMTIKDIFNFEDFYIKNNEINLMLQEGGDKGEIEVINVMGLTYLFIVNSSGECSLYLDINNILLKVDTTQRFLKFNTSEKVVITQCGDLVFMNTSIPVMMYLSRNEAYIYNCERDFCYVTGFMSHLLVISTSKVCKYDMQRQNASCVFHSNELIENPYCTCFDENMVNLKQQDILVYSSMIMKKFLSVRTPKNIVCVGNYYVVASCEREAYKPDSNIDQGIDVMTYRYFIDLYTNDFEFINTYQLESDEYVFDVKYLTLNDTIGKEGKSDFLVVCTTKIEGEDKQSRGRLIVFEISSIVADKSSMHKDKKLKLFASENIKGCITKCDELKGNIAVCLGIKLMVYKIDRSEGLIPIAIHDLYTLSTSISVIKNYLLVSDIYRGLSFFYYQKKPIRLNLLCTSEPIKEAMNIDFIIKDTEISFVCTDAKGNFHIYTYTPNNILSEGGTKMIKRYLIKNHLGLLKNSISLSKFEVPSFISDSNFFISLSGLTSKIYIMLFKLQSQILSNCKQTFGLNPQNFLNTTDHISPISLRKPIVGFLIRKFLNMDAITRKSLVRKAEIEETELYDFLNHEFNEIF